ncbi:MAG: hypothetical protein J07HR59_00862 [Halorubrum sp. J07HR59]|nr:MAG: hypothetical protein J07HR59_00862 [Halorubrum sp. J07HR59]
MIFTTVHSSPRKRNEPETILNGRGQCNLVPTSQDSTTTQSHSPSQSCHGGCLTGAKRPLSNRPPVTTRSGSLTVYAGVSIVASHVGKNAQSIVVNTPPVRWMAVANDAIVTERPVLRERSTGRYLVASSESITGSRYVAPLSTALFKPHQRKVTHNG